jgi:hypothetical protein
MAVVVHPVAGSQLSAVHRAPSSQSSGAPARQVLLAWLQVSAPSQTLPSLQSVSVVQQPRMAVVVHPLARSQLSVVQMFPSLQVIGKFTHRPLTQPSAVQALRSLQSLGVYTQPRDGLHVSTVHVSPSLQLIPLKTHPVFVLQLSLVHASLSLQTRGSPEPQRPAASQRSLVVQALPSLHGMPGAGLPTHMPAAQVSKIVQGLPSLQALAFGRCMQKLMTHVSVVQGLPSLQSELLEHALAWTVETARNMAQARATRPLRRNNLEIRSRSLVIAITLLHERPRAAASVCSAAGPA